MVKRDPGNHCFGSFGNDRRRADGLQRRVSRSRFEPARIDGKPVEVYVSFRVLYDETNGSCEANVMPNLGAEQDTYGMDYVAPQEIYTDGGWISPLRGAPWGHGRGLAFAMSVAVDELGNATDGRVETNNFAPEDTVRRALESLEKQRFIPAFIGGVARPARYFEFMYIPEPQGARAR